MQLTKNSKYELRQKSMDALRRITGEFPPPEKVKEAGISITQFVNEKKALMKNQRTKASNTLIIAGLLKNKSNEQISKELKLGQSSLSRRLKEPQFKTAMQEALDRAGLSNSRLAQKFTKLLDAKSPKELGGRIVDVDDNPTQLRAAVEVCKLKNSYPAEQVEVSGKLSLEQILSQSNDD